MHLDLQQAAAVTELDPPTGAGQRPRLGGVVGHVAAGRAVAAGRQQLLAAHGGALAVDHQPRRRGRGGRIGGAEAVDERGEHRGVQQPLAGAVADEARAGRDEVGRLQRTGQRAHQAGPRARVGVQRDHDVAAGRLEPLLQGPRLADPARRRLAPRDHRRAERRGQRRRCVPRAVVDHDHLGDARIALQPLQARAQPPLLVARGDHDRDARARRDRRGGERRPAVAAARQPRQRDRTRERLDEGQPAHRERAGWHATG